MEAFATYLTKSSVWLTGFALVYALFLRNERFFTLNRIYLVSGILFSMIFPLFTWHCTVLIPIVPSVEISEPQVQGIIVTEASFNPQNLLLLAYLAGILYLIFRFLRQTLPVFRIIRKSKTQLYSSAKLIRTDAYPASFSFFSFVFVNPSIDEIETNEIVSHELEHIRQQHWIDLLLFEILRTMQWFNPVSWLYGHLIRQNHEYLADERALQRSSNPAIYRAALLNQMFGGPVISLANSFNYSLNKKRFNMMKQKIESPFRKLKLLMVLPLIVGVFYAFAAPEYQFIGGEDNQSPQKSLYTITKDNIDIPFTTQLQKSDLETVKTELAKLGMKIEYTSLDFTNAGKLKQISAKVISSDGGSVSFFSGELTTTNYPTFKTSPDGSFGVFSQKAVTGKVITEDGKPLKGATVVIKGTTIGTVTNEKGNFKLVVSDDLPLVISYVGFETVSQRLSQSEMTITLKRNIASINFNNQTSEIRKKKPIDIENSNAPIIVDGNEISKYELSRINPGKIASIDVIKDKASIEKYGEKGKNGVVEITMKKGESASKNEPIEIKVTGQTNSGIQIRSTGISGSGSKPLIIIDGVIAENQNMDKIDPETIESISVIKNEESTKKYGDKGKNGVVEITLNAKSPYTVVEEMPSFPGGTEALNAFINANLKYPTIALENRIRGRVFVSFVVGKNGQINKTVKVTRGVDPALDKEALRIVKSMPNWNPGKQNGECVEVAYEMPIDFKIPADYHPISNEKLRTSRATANSNIKTKTNKTLRLSIVPNPTSDDARITLDGSGATNKLEISVYDSSGKLIKNASKNGPTFSLSINNLPPGIYSVVGKDVKNELSVTSQLVVNH